MFAGDNFVRESGDTLGKNMTFFFKIFDFKLICYLKIEMAKTQVMTWDVSKRSAILSTNSNSDASHIHLNAMPTQSEMIRKEV